MGLNIFESDLEYIVGNSKEFKNSENKVILVTGCAGFLGYSLINLFEKHSRELNVKKVYALDTFLMRKPDWIDKIKSPVINFYQHDVSDGLLSKMPNLDDVTHVFHMASIASPTFYRKYPLQTIDANVWGLRNILEYFKTKSLKGLLFFSSSEIYGDPVQGEIPTSENYNGNVSCLGPRACYDESKRFGETLCQVFSEQYGVPVKIVRPFNNYGPGMSVDDKRVPADFAKSILLNNDIVLHSDGSPTRTFCYVADAIIGYLKAIEYKNFDVFNIGIDKPEISINKLAKIYQEIGTKNFGYTGSVLFKPSDDSEYLTNNPDRRCPVITKARQLLNYDPSIEVEEGVLRYLTHLKGGEK